MLWSFRSLDILFRKNIKVSYIEVQIVIEDP